ncbi:unnamed protein product [Urochloa humidicola]
MLSKEGHKLPKVYSWRRPKTLTHALLLWTWKELMEERDYRLEHILQSFRHMLINQWISRSSWQSLCERMWS